MATNSQVSVTEGSGKNLATHSISETTTKEIQRIELNDSTGTELGTTANPVGVNMQKVAGTTVDTNSGTKSAGTQRVVIATDQPSLSNNLPVNIAAVGVVVPSPNETSSVYNGTTALTPKFAKITASSSGATTIVAAVTSKKIRVLKWDLTVNAAVNVKWQSHVTPTDISGLYYFAANGGIADNFCPVGHFETVAGEALDINLSGAIAVGGALTYIEI